MEKIKFDTLKEKAESIVSKNLLETISGGLENGCHVVVVLKSDGTTDIIIHKN